METAYLIHEFPRSSEPNLSREVLALRRLGLKITPFAFRGPWERQVSTLDRAGRKVLELTTYLRGGSLLHGLPVMLSRLRESWQENHWLQAVTIRKSDPFLRLLRAACLARRLRSMDIAHLHAHGSYALQVAWLVHRMTDLPFSASLRAHEVEQDLPYLPVFFEDLSFATFSNRAVMDRVVERLPDSARARCQHVGSGVDAESLAPQPALAWDGKLRVVSVGPLEPTSRFDRLISGCAQARMQGLRIELTLIGQGVLEAELRRLAARLGFSSHLHLPGCLPPDQIAAQLAEAHLFAWLAKEDAHDCPPDPVLEAMACGRPVLLPTSPAVTQAVQDGVEGFLLQTPDDEAGLVQALQRCAKAPQMLALMGQAARARVEREFDEPTQARRLFQLFEDSDRATVRRTDLAPVLEVLPQAA
jgi:glycosyltransferase involved in cell wall biosynthesis